MIGKIKALVYAFCASYFSLSAQDDPLRFKNEVEELIVTDSVVNKKNIILFTGSSSIRMWDNLEAAFPEYNVVNRGFGGSQMSDLYYYADMLITPYHPKQIFIYEGDNDLAVGKSSAQIIGDAEKLLKRIRPKLPRKTSIYFISAKPSIARENIKDKFIAYNALLKGWTRKNKRVYFIDVWSPMHNDDDKLKLDIFLEDGLHLNKQGYDIWANTIMGSLKKKHKKKKQVIQSVLN